MHGMKKVENHLVRQIPTLMQQIDPVAVQHATAHVSEVNCQSKLLIAMSDWGSDGQAKYILTCVQ